MPDRFEHLVDLYKISDRYKSYMKMFEGAEAVILDIGVRGDDSLSGGFTDAERDAYNRAEDVRVLRVIHEDRLNIGEYALGGGFDTSGSMSDTMMREMHEEIEGIFANPFFRKQHVRRRDHDNGAPRSIRETRRQQGRGKKASVMSGRKRK